jgi:AcrR family transcriptional regulator
MDSDVKQNDTSVRERLLKAAMDCFLDDEYHKVSTRKIASIAETNVAMIRYYFGNKEGLFEEMIRDKLQPVLDVLDGPLLSNREGFAEFFRLYYRTMGEHPEFPKLILKILALNQGPGKRFIQQLLERGRTRGSRKLDDMKKSGNIDPLLDPDMLRISFVSLAMMPMLLKEVYEEEQDRAMDAEFLDGLAWFNGRLFAAGLAPEN